MDSVRIEAVLHTSKKILSDVTRIVDKTLKTIANKLEEKLIEQIDNGLVSEDFKELLDAYEVLHKHGYHYHSPLQESLSNLRVSIQEDAEHYLKISPHTVLLYVMDNTDKIEKVGGNQSKEEYLIRKYIHSEVKAFFGQVLPVFVVKNILKYLDKVFPIDQSVVQDKLSEIVAEVIDVKSVIITQDEKDNTDK